MLNTYIVEHTVSAPAAADDAADVIARADHLLSGVGTGIVWVDAFAAGDARYSVFLATDAALVHAHVRATGLEDYRVSRVLATVRPHTAVD